MSIREKILKSIKSYESYNGETPDYLFLDTVSFSIYQNENKDQLMGNKIENMEYAIIEYLTPHIECHLKSRLDQVVEFWGGDADELSLNFNNNENLFLRVQIEAYCKRIGKEPFKLF
ncbi:hypothetical protein [Acinetobacter haemolyticus]|uniref:hypothetical protein n=1 Tax=Acinetobacter haemolyticus TaxID=29430 RepID=UPI000DEBD01D|nr:hypothetical protein [Acinetobacter haemolyticus]WHR57565.1 hypothetical protein PGW89_14275 [Acinetobacter haemolyticus]